ncbi:MAG: aminotransferase class I/II-fold pyridoxal phosphate-dependent enzyme [Candidatus Gastranaerophilaceae bacterium]
MLIDNFKLENWINSRENQTKYDLSMTCPKALTLNELSQICDCDFSKIKDIPLNYGSLHGSKELKQAICGLYNNQQPENITVTLGGIGANRLVIETLIDKGDKIVCICPTYQQVYTLAKFYGANVKLFFLEEDFSLDIEKFQKVVGKDTKLICITNPGNPTGLCIEGIEKIINIADKIGAYIFCDEVYRGLKHSQNSYTESISDIYAKGISTGSMSKAYSLAGIRLGWICANKDIIEKINFNREYDTISISILDDFIATKALNNHKKIIQRNLNIISENKTILDKFLSESKYLSWIKEPNAGTIGAIKYNLDETSENFCQNIFDNTGILLIPSSTFDTQKPYFRIGYAMNKEYLKEALNILEDYFRKTF